MPSLLPTPAVGTRVGFRLLFPDTRSVAPGGGEEGRGRWLSKEVGSVIIGAADGDGAEHADGHENGDAPEDEVADALKGAYSGDAEKTLADARFVIGDYVSCAILPPLTDGSVAPLPAPEMGRGYGGPSGGRGGPRDGGYGRGGYGGGRVEQNGFGGGGGGGFGGYRGGRGGRGGGFGAPSVPSGDWRRGERIPEGPGSFGRGRDGGRPY